MTRSRRGVPWIIERCQLVIGALSREKTCRWCLVLCWGRVFKGGIWFRFSLVFWCRNVKSAPNILCFICFVRRSFVSPLLFALKCRESKHSENHDSLHRRFNETHVAQPWNQTAPKLNFPLVGDRHGRAFFFWFLAFGSMLLCVWRKMCSFYLYVSKDCRLLCWCLLTLTCHITWLRLCELYLSEKLMKRAPSRLWLCATS